MEPCSFKTLPMPLRKLSSRMMNSSEEWSLCTVKTQPLFPSVLVQGEGDSLHLPAGALLCPAQHGVFSVCFQVLLASPECFWGSQPVPGAALRCTCLPSRGVSEPRYCRNGPSRPHQSSHGLLVESALILDIVCDHVF